MAADLSKAVAVRGATATTAPERCPTCDREGCPALANAMTIAERKAYARLLEASDLGQRIDADTRAAIESAANRGAAALADCHARAIAAEAERSEIVALVSPSSDQSLPDAVRELCEHVEELRPAAAQWAKVAPLIERLRWPKSPRDEEQLVAAILAATEATP